jgi:hypothetical protein|nr:MAG TPA: internal virion protein C [Caudoviricetes sp.]
MAYKNSDGNSSIANQWGQWRYFNSALDKLGTAKPATISINENNVTIPEADNWLECFKDVAKAVKGGFEAKKELSYKLADDYLKSHSLEQYREEMTKGLVPFQDDPLAMARLKESHGQMLFQYISEDFQRRVDTNEFKGKAPEEVDAEFFKFMRENVSDVAKQFGYSSEDVFFNRGVFANSPAERIKMMTRQKEVEHKFNVQDMFITESAKVHAIIQNGGDAVALVSALSEMDLTVGRFLDPEHQNKLWTSVISSLENSPEGFFTLQQLADSKDLPFANGVTLREYLGEDGYKTSLIKAYNYKYKRDTKAYLNYQNGLDNLADSGELSVLEAIRDSELEANGNILTDRVKDIEKAVDRAREVQRSALRSTAVKAQQEQKALIKKNLAKKFLKDASLGKELKSSDSSDISSDDLNVALDDMIESGELTTEGVLGIAKNSSVPFRDNPARRYFKDKAEAASEKLTGITADYLNSGMKPETIPKEPPEEITQMIELYRTDPQAFLYATGSTKGFTESIHGAILLMEGGRSWEDVVKRTAGFEKLKADPKGRAKIEGLRIKVNTGVTEISKVIGTEIDQTGKDFIYNMACRFVGSGETPSRAIELAKDVYRNQYVTLLGTSVPARVFTSRAYGNADPKMAKELFREEFDYGDDSKYSVDYNEELGRLVVYERGTYNYVKSYTTEDIQRTLDKAAERKAKELEKEMNATVFDRLSKLNSGTD